MKKIIGIVIASLMFANIGFAATEIISQTMVQSLKKSKSTTTGDKSKKCWVYNLCVDNYKILVVRDIYVSLKGGGGTALSMVQPYEERDGKSLPAKC